MPIVNPLTGALSTLRRDWYDATRTIYQDCSTGACRIVLSDGTAIAPNTNADQVAGNGGVGVWLKEQDATVYDTLGRSWPGADVQRGSVSPDGAYPLKLARNSFGPWDVIEQDGSRWRLTDGNATDIQLLGNRRAIWNEGGVTRATGGIVPPNDALDSRPRACFVNGRLIFLYQRQPDGMLCCGDGVSGIHQVAPPAATYFYPDIAYVNGRILIRWSLNQADLGDGPGVDLTLAELDALPPAPAPVTMPTFALGHPVLVCPFKDPDGDTLAPAEIIVNQMGQRHVRAYFVAEDSLGGPFLGERLGIYSEAADPSAAIALAKGLNTRLLLAHDAPATWLLPANLLRAFDIPALECYLVVGETTQQSIARWQLELDALLASWPGDVALIPMFYCSGGAPPNETFTVAQVLTGLGALSGLVNRSPRVKVIAPFAYLRANGIIGHPELAAAFTQLLIAAGRAGLATLTPIPPSPAPTPRPPAPIPKPQPEPTPAPPVPSTPFPAAHPLGGSMRVFLKLNGKYIGIDPTPVHGQSGDAAFPVYHDRAAGGEWEAVELAQQGDGRFQATFIASNRVLSIQPDGSLQSRAAGTYGAYEAIAATTQPDPDAINLLYRVADGQLLGEPLMIEEAA